MRKLSIVLLLWVVVLAAEVVEFDHNWAPHPLFNVMSQTPVGVEVVFSMHQMVIEEQEIDGVMMKAFGVPTVYLSKPGTPNLNGVSRIRESW